MKEDEIEFIETAIFPMVELKFAKKEYPLHVATVTRSMRRPTQTKNMRTLRGLYQSLREISDWWKPRKTGVKVPYARHRRLGKRVE